MKCNPARACDVLPLPLDLTSLAKLASRWWALRLDQPGKVARSFEAALYVLIFNKLEEQEGFFFEEVDHYTGATESVLTNAMRDAGISYSAALGSGLPFGAMMSLLVRDKVVVKSQVREGFYAPLEDLYPSLMRRGSPTFKP